MPQSKKSRSAAGNGTIRKKTVHKNGKEYTYWEARFTTGYDPVTGKQKQRSITGKTQKEVAQKLRKATIELDMGTYIDPSDLTLGEWLDIWQREYLGNVKASSAYKYRRDIELHIVPYLGAANLQQLSGRQIQSLYNELCFPKAAGVRPLSPKSVKDLNGILHKALQQAIKLGYIRFNPCDACVLPRVETPEIKPMDEACITDFLKAIEGHPHEYLYKIALFTGMRESEVLGLPWDCVDLVNGTVLVKQQLRREQQKGGKYYISSPKNNKRRVLALAPSVVELFKLQQAKQNEQRQQAGELWENTGLVFSNQVGGYLSYRTVYDCFKRIVAQIGVPETRFHDLRHSYAVAAIKSGDDIKTVQDNLGHATASFTLDVYGHVTNQMKRASADRMEAFIQSVSA